MNKLCMRSFAGIILSYFEFAEELTDEAIGEEKPTDTVKVTPPPVEKEDSKEHVNIVFIGHVGMFIE